MSDTLSKEYCIHLRTFFTGKTLSKYYYCIYWCILLHRNSTFVFILLHRNSTFLYIILTLLFESNTASNEGLSLQVRFFQGPAASIKALCYKAMLHVLKQIAHHSPQSIQKCKFPGTYIYIYILCLNISNLDRNVYVRIQGSKVPKFQDLHRSC